MRFINYSSCSLPNGFVFRVQSVAVILFCFFSFLGTAGANLSFLVLLLVFFCNLKFEAHLLKKDVPTLLLIIFIVYVVFNGYIASTFFQDTGADQWQGVGKWVILLFPVFSYAILRTNQQVSILLFIISASLCLDLVQNIIREPSTYINTFNGAAFDFGKAQNPLGLYIATVIIGMTIFSYRFASVKRGIKKQYFAITAWVFVLVFLFHALMATTSRSSWASLFVGLTISLLLLISVVIRKKTHFSLRMTKILRLMLLLIVIFGMLLFVNYKHVVDRIDEEELSYNVILNGKLSDLPYTTSLGKRFHIFEYGIDKWLEKPWLGWGPSDSKYLIAKHPNPLLSYLSHFHNAYLELLVRLGIIGFAIFSSIIILLLIRFIHAYRQGHVPLDVFVFLIAAFSMLAVWSFTGSRLTNADWRFYWIILAGITHMYTLRSLHEH